MNETGGDHHRQNEVHVDETGTNHSGKAAIKMKPLTSQYAV